MTNQQTHKSDEDAIKDILLAPVRARIQTSDIRAGMLSSTGLNEKVADLTMLVQQARQQERERVLEWANNNSFTYNNGFGKGANVIAYNDVNEKGINLEKLRTFLTNPNTTV